MVRGKSRTGVFSYGDAVNSLSNVFYDAYFSPPFVAPPFSKSDRAVASVSYVESVNRQQERQPAPPTTAFAGKKWGDLRDLLDELGLSSSEVSRVIGRAKNTPDDAKDGNYNKTVTVRADGEKYDLKLRFRNGKLQSWTLKQQKKKTK